MNKWGQAAYSSSLGRNGQVAMSFAMIEKQGEKEDGVKVVSGKFTSIFAEWNCLKLRKKLKIPILDSLGSEIIQVDRVYRARSAGNPTSCT